MASGVARRVWGAAALSDQERDSFFRLVAAEAPSGDADAQRNVASVIFNRMYKKGIPFSQVATRSQFEPIRNGSINNIPSWKYQQTVKNLAPMFSGNMGDTTNGADHFFSPASQSAMSAKDNRALVPKWADPNKLTKKDRAGHWFYNLGSFATGADTGKRKNKSSMAFDILNDSSPEPFVSSGNIDMPPEYRKRVDNIMRAVQPKGSPIDMESVINAGIEKYVKNPAPHINDIAGANASSMNDFIKLYGLDKDPLGVTSGNIQNDPYQQSINGVNTLKNVFGLDTLK